MTYRILITGSRLWTDQRLIKTTMQLLHREHPDAILVHGAARGADTFGSRYWQALGGRIEAHPAEWEQCAPSCPPRHKMLQPLGEKAYCPGAGHRRNAHMVNAGADVCIAFIRAHSRGASATASSAEAAGIPTYRYFQEA